MYWPMSNVRLFPVSGRRLPSQQLAPKICSEDAVTYRAKLVHESHGSVQSGQQSNVGIHLAHYWPTRSSQIDHKTIIFSAHLKTTYVQGLR